MREAATPPKRFATSAACGNARQKKDGAIFGPASFNGSRGLASAPTPSAFSGGSFSFLGAIYLKTRVKGVLEAKPKPHTFIWCLGASLSRLLPVIEINKEFSDFFNDPERKRLTGFQSAVFSIIGIIGFVLGAVLVAAVSGLTQDP